MVLWIILVAFSFQLQGYYLLWRSFPTLFIYDIASMLYVRNPNEVNFIGLACSAFARRYLRNRISFSSSRYLDVSVPRVVLPGPMCSGRGYAHCCAWVRPFGDPRVEGCVLLAGDYRSLPRPSSAPCAKASAVRPWYLAGPLSGPRDIHVSLINLINRYHE